MRGSAEDSKMFYSPEGLKELEKAMTDFGKDFHKDLWFNKDKAIFKNLNGTVYTGEKAPEGMAALEIENKIYWTEVKEIQALQDFLSLRVRQAEKKDAKLTQANKGIKKIRNKMLHKIPAKKKRR